MKLVKFKSDSEGSLYSDGKPTSESIYSGDHHKTHLLTTLGDGEYTACGQAVTEYDLVPACNSITCQSCIGVIKYYKSIKL